jgi:hypothetical protein
MKIAPIYLSLHTLNVLRLSSHDLNHKVWDILFFFLNYLEILYQNPCLMNATIPTVLATGGLSCLWKDEILITKTLFTT